ncbi:MAG: YidC/Oxa1 family insertase periplasmic-domain containing protein [bacterium]|nr:YidC/Oxa1 family insertase periplasmic-domain containing protein [Candidatus Colisoma equi]
MNKTEKLICVVLGAALAWYIFSEMGKAKERASQSQVAEVAAQGDLSSEQPTNRPADQVRNVSTSSVDSVSSVVEKEQKKVHPSTPEKTVTLENDEVKLELSTWGAVVKKVTLKKYAKDCGPITDENPPVVLDFSDSPLGAGETVEAFDVVAQDSATVSFRNGGKSRTISLGKDYQIKFDDAGFGGSVSLGAMRMGDSKNDLLSVDSWAMDAGKGKPGVIHHGDDDSPLKPYLVGGLAGGCSGSKSAAGMPEKTSVDYPGAQTWIAVKNRFFVTALASCSEANAGFTAEVKRDVSAANYKPESVTALVNFKDGAVKRTATFFVGPKKQSLLWDLGMKDVMEFGMWRWLCYPLVWVLNLFNGWIPNFGVAIILLTILVRLLFWPLTRKSTEGMKKMQELQPLMKEIQAKYKDNPQRLQQETWQLYREKKVNPMSSCLPMLIQIPVFIALFNVLRSAVELRYAPFLWIADLSEPEGLFASWFPFGGLNLLPILMAVSTALQSYFTPSTGDKKQQQMMMVMMPAMMLIMFYSFPSALSLYWFLSNIFSIVQMWLIRRQTAAKQGEALVPEVIDPPQTRQMRRHQ